MSGKHRTAIVIGDVMLDRQVDGVATRMTPDAPVPILQPERVIDTPGGAAHVARNMAAMGVRTQLIGVIGQDAPGARLHELLTATEGVAPWLLYGQSKTTFKTRFTTEGHIILRVDEEGPPRSPPEQVWACFLEAMQREDVGLLVISDYDKGAVTELGPHLIRYCSERKIPVFVDARPQSWDAYRGASLLKPNLSEAMRLCLGMVEPGLYTTDVPSKAETGARELCKKYGAGAVVVTAGPWGAGWSDGMAHDFVPASPCAGSPVGAGDTFLAALAVGALQGQTLHTATTRAVAAASLAVSKPGIAVVTADEMEEATYQLGSPATKHMSQYQAAKFSKRRRDAGQQVGFVNGCFDALHPGHISLLQYARDNCKTLIVAYDSDASVRLLKGPDRPLIPAETRAKMLEPFADALVCFNTDQLLELIKAVRPDVLIKGAEYKNRLPIGADFVASHGGLVLFAPMIPGFSTTRIAETLRAPPTV